MNIRTRGKSDNLPIRELKDATVFIYAHLVSEKVHNRTRLMIKFVNPGERDKKRGWQGCTYYKSNTEYVIKLNKNLSRKKILLTLAHELVHVKQYSMNQLGADFYHGGAKFTMWKRKLVDVDKYGYFFTPWEVEAAGKEYGLYKIFETHPLRRSSSEV